MRYFTQEVVDLKDTLFVPTADNFMRVQSTYNVIPIL